MKPLFLSLVLVVGLGVVSAQFKNILDDPDRKSCRWTYLYATSYTLNGDHFSYYSLTGWDFVHPRRNKPLYDRISWAPQSGVPKPPRDWDGSESTLGYPLPDKGTELYKYLLCWPDVPNHILGATDPSEWNIKQDPDRIKCYQWDGWTSDGHGKIKMGKFNPPGGFPKLYEIVMDIAWKTVPRTMTVNSSPVYQKPPQDWDGRKSTLGFPLPAKGTAHYNMLLCWPYDIRQN